MLRAAWERRSVEAEAAISAFTRSAGRLLLCAVTTSEPLDVAMRERLTLSTAVNCHLGSQTSDAGEPWRHRK